jgi:hypothetical protein
MTKEKKREYNQEFSRKKRAQGWRFCGFVVPPTVAVRVLNFKRLEMSKYRAQEVEA